MCTKRDPELVIAHMFRWRQFMFLDDDIYGVVRPTRCPRCLLSDHSVSVLVPSDYAPVMRTPRGVSRGGSLARVEWECAVTEMIWPSSRIFTTMTGSSSMRTRPAVGSPGWVSRGSGC